MSELLTADEREALRGLFPPSSASREVTLAQFPSVTQLDPLQTTALSAGLRRWLDIVVRDLSRSLRTSCAALPLRTQMVGRASLTPTEEEHFWCLADGDRSYRVLVSMPRRFAAAISERLFGSPLEEVGERRLSLAETRVIRELVEDWSRKLSEAWPGHTFRSCPPPEPGDSTGSGEEGAQSWLRFTGDLTAGPVEGAITVTLLPNTARQLLDRAAAPPAETPTAQQVARRLGEIPVELRAVLGSANLTLDELTGIQKGDVIPLMRRVEEPLEIVIDGRTQFYARTGLAGESVALEIVAPPAE
jgi:flagellar motor switch/type III secretory pathway protein FliN